MLFTSTISQLSITNSLLISKEKMFIEFCFIPSWNYPGCHYCISSRLRLMLTKVFPVLFQSQELSLKLTDRKRASLDICQNGREDSAIHSWLFNFRALTFPPHQFCTLSCTNFPNYTYLIHDRRRFVHVVFSAGRHPKILSWRYHG